MRIIDADALKEKLINMFSDYEYVTQKDSYLIELLELIEDAPTVIDHSKELVKKSIELGRNVGYFEGKTESKRPQGELISREALKNELNELRKSPWFNENCNGIIGQTSYQARREALNIVEELVIDNAPTVDIPNYGGQVVPDTLQGWRYDARPQGEWIIVKDKKWGDNVKCPFCEKELAGTDLNFCCKCGAKLIGSEKMNGGAV